ATCECRREVDEHDRRQGAIPPAFPSFDPGDSQVREQQHASRRRRKFDDDEPHFVRRITGHVQPDVVDDGPEVGDRWTSWDTAGVLRGPEPWPDWVITELAAVDTDLGILKTGKEADVWLVERGIPDTDRSVLLAAKRYRTPEHRLFHRDAGYLEGRRV